MEFQAFNCHDQQRPSWYGRAEQAVRMLEPVARSLPRPLVLADVGCGDMKLREILQRGGFPFLYRPYDIVPQCAEVAALDIRRDTVPAGTDVVVMLGVGEYIEDLSAVLQRMASMVPYLLVTHVVREFSSYTPERLRELGWVNHMAEADFAALLVSAGWTIETRQATADRRTVLWLARSARVPAA